MSKKPKSVPETAPAPSAPVTLADVEAVRRESHRTAIATARTVAAGGSVPRESLEHALMTLNGSFDATVQAEKYRLEAAAKLPDLHARRASLVERLETAVKENAEAFERRDRLKAELPEAENLAFGTYNQRNRLGTQLAALDDELAAVEPATEVPA